MTPEDGGSPGPHDASVVDRGAWDAPAADGPAVVADARDGAQADAGLDGGDADAASPGDSGADVGPGYGCSDLPTIADTTTQVAVVLAAATSTCTDLLVQQLLAAPATYVAAFVQIAGSSESSHLFYSAYDLMPQMKWDKPIVDVLYAGMQGAVDQLPADTNRDNWQTFFIDNNLDIGNFYRCPTPLPTTTAGLLGELSYADYYCTESVAQVMAALLDQPALDQLLALSQSGSRGWTRRNAWRVIGRLAEHPAGGPPRSLLDANAAAIRAAAQASLANDRYENVLHDAIWVLDAAFFPTYDALAALEALSLDASRGSALRFRASAAASRLITNRTGTVPSGDTDYLVAALAADDFWVRAEAAFTAEQIYKSSSLSFSSADDTRVGDALSSAYAVETVLTAQVYEARAIDARTGSSLAAQLRTDYEAAHLPNLASGSGFTIRSGLAAAELPALVALLEAETGAFSDLLGAGFSSPVPGDANAVATVVVFATMQEYQDYMNAFVGYAANAGGLYVEGTATLFTFQRTPAQSTYTLEELLQHEYAHRLQARYVYPGVWGDAGYFDEARGWADEGTAELFAGIDFSVTPYDADPLRSEALDRLCPGPFRALDSLLQQRVGYDQTGTFDYDNAWAFLYFMMHPRRSTMLTLYDAWRAGTYHYAQWEALTGVSVAALEAEWWAALTGYCAQPRPLMLLGGAAPGAGHALRVRGDEPWLGRLQPAGH